MRGAQTAAVESKITPTMLSIDGVGAYDTISRHSMLAALAAVPGANRCSPFVNMFYSHPSNYVWHDQHSQPHLITQAEGGEQGDPLMPALLSLGQKAALHNVQQSRQESERLYAFLDDVYVTITPDRVRPVYDLLAHHLSDRRTSPSTPARPEFGTEQGPRRHTSPASAPRFGLATSTCQPRSAD